VHGAQCMCGLVRHSIVHFHVERPYELSEVVGKHRPSPHIARGLRTIRFLHFPRLGSARVLWVPIIHPCWSGSMLVLVEDAAESVSPADIEVRDLLGIGNRFG
jgi:hypothetical protein